MRIGELAERTGASVRSLRYYEQQDLLTSQRTSSGQRIYGEDAVDRVALLRRMYRAGLSSATIARVMPCVDTPSEQVTRDTVAVLRREHARLGDEIEQLVATRDQLAYLIGCATDFHRDQLDAVDAAGAVPA